MLTLQKLYMPQEYTAFTADAGSALPTPPLPIFSSLTVLLLDLSLLGMVDDSGAVFVAFISKS